MFRQFEHHVSPSKAGGFNGFAAMGRVMGVCCSLMGSLGGSSGGVLGLDNVSESEVSSVDVCAAGGCRNWV